jgi:hypothetical protein
MPKGKRKGKSGECHACKTLGQKWNVMADDHVLQGGRYELV